MPLEGLRDILGEADGAAVISHSSAMVNSPGMEPWLRNLTDLFWWGWHRKRRRICCPATNCIVDTAPCQSGQARVSSSQLSLLGETNMAWLIRLFSHYWSLDFNILTIVGVEISNVHFPGVGIDIVSRCDNTEAKLYLPD